MTNSRQKGARGERELAAELRKYGYDARRGQQYCGANGDADVVGIPGIHIECKRVEKLNIDGAVEQAVRDCKDGEIPTVFHRRNGKPWLVTMLLEDWVKMHQNAEALSVLLNETDVDYVCGYMIACGDWCGDKARNEIGDCIEDVTICYVEYLRRTTK